MTADCLFDTNVLVYAVDATLNNRAKQARAIELIGTVNFGLSAQVLQEFYVTATRKLEKPLMPEVALQFLDRFQAFPIVAVDQRLVVEGIQNSVKFRVSCWDGAILAAANRLHATVVYSEDLNHAQLYGTIKVINPFF